MSTVKYIPIALLLALFTLTIAMNNMSFFNSEDVQLNTYVVGMEVMQFILLLFIYILRKDLKLCNYNNVALVGLMVLNIVNIIFAVFPLSFCEYESLLTYLILGFTTTISSILFYKNP